MKVRKIECIQPGKKDVEEETEWPARLGESLIEMGYPAFYEGWRDPTPDEREKFNYLHRVWARWQVGILRWGKKLRI